jgi:hypothetical protein
MLKFILVFPDVEDTRVVEGMVHHFFDGIYEGSVGYIH